MDFEIITKEEFESSGVDIARKDASILRCDTDEGKSGLSSRSLDVSTPEMQLCQWCGWCEDPDHCVWSVQCPVCCAPQMQQCTASDGRITGLHQERWDYAGNRS